MAFYDNKYWVLSHVRNSFLYSDDTGMCEMVLRNNDIPQEIIDEGKKNWYGDLDDSGEEYDDDGRIAARSVSNCYDGDFGARRRRLNTAVRLDKLRKEQQAAALIQNIRWRDPDAENVETEKDQTLFQKKKVVRPKSHVNSALSLLIAETNSDTPTLYMEYAKFDGSIQSGVVTRTIRIYVHVGDEESRYPLTICVVASAKVSELIGLTCYTHNCQKQQPEIREPIDNFALFIAEDDGSPDKDFPCLDRRENVSKFGFTTLAMVKIAAPSPSVPRGQENEVAASPVAEGSRVSPQPSATDYQTFRCFLLQKIRPKTEVFLGISWDHLDIKSVPGARSSVTVASLLFPLKILRFWVSFIIMWTDGGGVGYE
nr:EOG090X072S [Eulimnadia texana]